ncbi:hypothetical protein AB0F91_39640 [Amycolatopsis sp. NPDC023774]|uniref:hypothetical protein n=1 Tax=Amycolatopsis sp. NPDC023774 TaxID=3155015 RepID=UPI0033D57F0E
MSGRHKAETGKDGPSRKEVVEMMLLTVAVLLVVIMLVLATHVATRARRYAAWEKMVTGLPPGSRLTGLERDGRTMVEIGYASRPQGKNARVSRGRR